MVRVRFAERGSRNGEDSTLGTLLRGEEDGSLVAGAPSPGGVTGPRDRGSSGSLGAGVVGLGVSLRPLGFGAGVIISRGSLLIPGARVAIAASEAPSLVPGSLAVVEASEGPQLFSGFGVVGSGVIGNGMTGSCVGIDSRGRGAIDAVWLGRCAAPSWSFSLCLCRRHRQLESELGARTLSTDWDMAHHSV